MTFQHISRLCMTVAICATLTACNDNNNTTIQQQASGVMQKLKPAASSPASALAASEAAAASRVNTNLPPIVNLPPDAPVVTVATTGKTRPFSYTEENGMVAGLDVDVITKIGEAQGFRVQVHKRPWQNLFSDVEVGQYQLAISGISYTPDRAEKYHLSESYARNPSILMFTNSEWDGKVKDLKSLKNIPNLSVGVLDGSKHMKQMTEAGVSNITPYKTTYLLFSGLLKNEVSMIAQDGLLLQQMAKEHAHGRKIHTFTYENEEEPSAQLVILMHKDNTELLNKVNAGLAQIKENGELAKIHTKWIGKNTNTETVVNNQIAASAASAAVAVSTIAASVASPSASAAQ